jgi:regulatory protein
MQTKRLTPGQAKISVQHYCAYQERCHAEVKDKLYSFGLTTAEVEEIVSDLIADDHLNEERFARAFARGKFRMKNWGRVKIRYELKQKRVSEYCIRKGLTEIADEDYERTLDKLFEEKWISLKGEKNIFVKKKKVTDYLMQKGYERDLIVDRLKTA